MAAASDPEDSSSRDSLCRTNRNHNAPLTDASSKPSLAVLLMLLGVALGVRTYTGR